MEENLAKFQCLDLKAKATRLKLMTHVYTPLKVVKLKNIRYTLNKNMAEVETVILVLFDGITHYGSEQPVSPALIIYSPTSSGVN